MLNKKLSQIEGFQNSRISVIHNCLSQIFFDEKQWVPLKFNRPNCDYLLGYLGRDYPHKNTNLFPKIALLARKKFNLKLKFAVTFTKDEWLSKSEEFRNVCYNVGKINVSQCPSFYKNVDAVFFPSSVESFSALLLETLFMGKRLFVNDKDFNRDVCGKFATYFDIRNLEKTVQSIKENLEKPLSKKDIKEGQLHVLSFSSAEDRKKSYLELIQKYAR